MDKFNTYFGQVVTDNDLNTILNELMGSIQSFVQDFGYSGIAVGGDVVPNTSPNLTVGVTAPGVVYDQFGNRILFGSPLTVDCSVDENNQSTAVTTSGNAKWLSVFIKFRRTPTDPRVNDLGEQVFFREVAGYELRVVQAAESSASVALRPALRGDSILLADIKMTSGKTAIVAGDIDFTRRQVIYNIPGSPLAINAKNLQGVITAVLGLVNSINSTTIQIPALTGNPDSTAAGSLNSVLAALLALINTKAEPVPPDDLSHFAVFDGSQEFTAKQTFNSIDLKDLLNMLVADPGRGLMATGNTPGANLWYKIFDFKWGSPNDSYNNGQGQYWKAYTGNDASGRGCFVMCVNASWDGTKWVKRSGDNLNTPSSAIIFTYNRIRISSSVGVADWAEWPANLPANATVDGRGLHVVDNVVITGRMRVGSDIDSNANIGGQNITAAAVLKGNSLNVDTAVVQGVVTAGGITVPEGNIGALYIGAPTLEGTVLVKGAAGEFANDVKVDGLYKYKTPKTYTKAINLAKSWLTGQWSYGSNSNVFNHSSTGELPDASMLVPIELPNGSKLTKIELSYRANSGSFGALFLARPQIVLPTDPGPADAPAANTMIASGAALNGALASDNSFHIATWFPGDPFPSDGQPIYGNTLYYLMIICAHEANCTVAGVNVTFKDSGPTNL